jgi:hypothetical protein
VDSMDNFSRVIFDALLWDPVSANGKRVQPRRGCAFLFDVTGKATAAAAGTAKRACLFFCQGLPQAKASGRKRREALGMGSKSSKVSNVHNDEAGSGGGKTSGSVIDKLTEAQLDEFREAFNSFDKVRSAPG